MTVKPFFITSTGTNIGKTLVTAALTAQLRAAGRKVKAMKPIISGYDPAEEQNDVATLLRARGMVISEKSIETVAPWRFREPLSPHMCAWKEGREIRLEEVVAFCRAEERKAEEYLLVEGVGGVMVPLHETHTVLDWMAVLGYPVLVVTGSYLGTISHTLTALEVLKAHNIDVHALIVSSSGEPEAVPPEDTIRTFCSFLGDMIPIRYLPRIDAQEPWQHAPPLADLVGV